jgi:hypothetical protein
MVKSKVMLAALLLSVASMSGAAAQTANTTTDSPATGRFQIVMSRLNSQNIFMIDTATGRIWQLAQDNTRQGDPSAWMTILPGNEIIL